MQTTRAAAMIQSRMWSDERQIERRARSVYRSFYVCSDTNTSNIRC
jgi:hypothetical protein